MTDDFAERFRQAKREQDEIRAADPSRQWSDPTLPVARFAAMETLAALQPRFAAGEGAALMDALALCARHDITMPAWVARGYLGAYHQVLDCKAKSWDEVFGDPHPKGQHLAARRKKRNLAPAVWSAVREARDMGRPIDEALFADIGKQLGLGKTLVAEFYYEMEKTLAK